MQRSHTIDHKTAANYNKEAHSTIQVASWYSNELVATASCRFLINLPKGVTVRVNYASKRVGYGEAV
jgi:hypothetical protein